MAEPIPAPKNEAVEAVKAVIDKLVEGLGVNAAVAAGIAAWPFLGTPVIKNVFAWVVAKFAAIIDADLKKIAIKLVIRVQSTGLKNEFNEAIKPIVAGSPTDEQIKKAREAADRIIERNRT